MDKQQHRLAEAGGTLGGSQNPSWGQYHCANGKQFYHVQVELLRWLILIDHRVGFNIGPCEENKIFIYTFQEL